MFDTARRPRTRLAAGLLARGRRRSGQVRAVGAGSVLLALPPEGAEDLAAGDRCTLLLPPVVGSGADGGEIRLEVRLQEVGTELLDAGSQPAVGLELEVTGGGEEAAQAILARAREQRPELLLVGFGAASRESLERLVGKGVAVVAVDGEEEALDRLEERDVAVLCLGEELAGPRACRFLETVRARLPLCDAVCLVLAGGPDPTLFQDLISDDAIFYLTQEPVFDSDLLAILRSAVGRWWLLRRSRGPAEPGDGVTGRVHQVLEAARRVAIQRDMASAGTLTVEAIEEVLEVDRAYYLVYDEPAEVLWSAEVGQPAERQESAAVGLVSFVARTGRPVLRDRLASDARYEREADDPAGNGEERFLAVPVRGADGKVLAVLVAIRDAAREPFAEADLAMLQLLADQVASTFNQLGLESRLAAAAGAGEGAEGEGPALFRRRALEEHFRGAEGRGEPLRLSPRWASWSYYLLVAVCVAGFLLALLGTVREYASGPAVVHFSGIRDLTATTSGTVVDVSVSPGERVEAGRVLVRFYGAEEQAELERLNSEFELQLANRLRDPSDAAAAQALISLRAQRQLARARLEERTLRAPEAGVVSDVRVRPGQHVSPGQSLVALSRERGEPRIVALLPGHYRPQLHPGLPLRLELVGYRYGYQHLVVDTVSDEIVGPGEARRYLGPAVGDAVTLPGPVVLVEARLPSREFEADGHTYAYHDGMFARAEVPVRSETIAVTLFPGLKALRENEGD